MEYNDDNKFNLYLAKINDAYEKNAKENKDIIKRYTDYISKSKDKKINGVIIKVGGENIEPLSLIICLLMILLLGLFNIQGIGMYIFGFIFFVAGMFIGMFVPVVGLIFFISHGFTGFGVMIASLDIIKIFPLITDAPQYLIFILGCIVLSLVVLTIIFVIMCNFRKNRKKKYFICYPFICVFILILLLNLIPFIIKIFS